MPDVEKQELTSLDIKTEQLQKLKQIFPEVFTEGTKIDFDKLRLTLGEDVDTSKERYGMNWHGKAECFKTIQQPSIATLIPDRNESIDFDDTQNVFIEGDNLEVLKLLQKSYLSKVKMIYIDPPYNTGKEFIYPDNFKENLETYLEYTHQVDSDGKKFSTNTDTDGRFHSKWLNMMYPRLFLAKNLLREDGVIFISIGHDEFDNLKKVCDEIFGEENFISGIVNVNNPKGRSDDRYIATSHEYLLIYKKQEIRFVGWKPHEKITKRFNKIDDSEEIYREIDLRKTGDNDRRENRPNMFYYFYYNPLTKELIPSKEKKALKNFYEIRPIKADGTDGCWRWEINTASKNLNSLVAKEMPNRGIWGVFEKDFLNNKVSVKPTSSWTDKVFNSERGTEQFMELGFQKEIFPKPKPIGLSQKILELVTGENKEDFIILDFFAGSATTAHAVMQLNAEDGGNRKYICVQLPEPCDQKSEAFKAGYTTIAEISKERIRRASAKIKTEIEMKAAKENSSLFNNENKNSDIDLGFKVFKLAPSNFKRWDNALEKQPELLQQKLFDHIEHINADAEQEAILYELLLKSGFELTTRIVQLTLAEKKVYSVADGALLICLENELTLECLKAMAELCPPLVICLDRSFTGENGDALKTNAVQIMKSKGVGKFRTV